MLCKILCGDKFEFLQGDSMVMTQTLKGGGGYSLVVTHTLFVWTLVAEWLNTQCYLFVSVEGGG